MKLSSVKYVIKQETHKQAYEETVNRAYPHVCLYIGKHIHKKVRMIFWLQAHNNIYEQVTDKIMNDEGW